VPAAAVAAAGHLEGEEDRPSAKIMESPMMTTLPNNSPPPLFELFLDRFRAVSGEFLSSHSSVSITKYLKQLVEAEEYFPLVIGRGAPAGLVKELSGSGEILADWSDGGEPKDVVNLCGRAKASITGVDGLIADTGTLVVVSLSPGDRAASLLPPVHIAVMLETPIYKTLGDYLAVCDKQRTHQFITGSSRTSDIEKELVLGVHGPLKLILVGDSTSII